MAIEYGSRGLVGVLTPQANTTVEPELSILLPRGYAAINARLTSDKPTIESRLVDYFDHYGETCEQFANAPVSALAFACTGASYLAGREREARTLDALSTRFGVPAVTAATAVVDALRELGARRIALASPYPEGLNQRSVQYWESQGLEIVSVVSATTSATAFHPIYTMSAETAAGTLDSLARLDQPVDAIVMLGTGMPTLGPILARSSQPGPPLLSCMLCLGWRTIKAIHPEDADLAAWLRATHWGPALKLRMAPADTPGGA